MDTTAQEEAAAFAWRDRVFEHPKCGSPSGARRFRSVARVLIGSIFRIVGIEGIRTHRTIAIESHHQIPAQRIAHAVFIRAVTPGLLTVFNASAPGRAEHLFDLGAGGLVGLNLRNHPDIEVLPGADASGQDQQAEEKEQGSYVFVQGLHGVSFEQCYEAVVSS